MKNQRTINHTPVGVPLAGTLPVAEHTPVGVPLAGTLPSAATLPSAPLSVAEQAPMETPLADTLPSDTPPFAGMAGLAIVLGQLVAYFSGRADVDDLDVLSFSLHHLFCRVHFLYQEALPNLSDCARSMS